MSGKYECENPPCIHVVLDPRRKRYAVFIEDAEGSILYIEAEKVLTAAKEIEKLKRAKFREAEGDEVDELAREYLGAEPVEE